MTPESQPASAVERAGGEMMLSLNEAQYANAQQAGVAAPMEIDLPEAELSLATGIWDMNTLRAGTLHVSVSPKRNLLADQSSH